jgi:lysophospholipase L1-like esterase
MRVIKRITGLFVLSILLTVTTNIIADPDLDSYVISSQGCIYRLDHLHFKPAGYRKLGERYAVKMLSLLGYDVHDSLSSEKND